MAWYNTKGGMYYHPYDKSGVRPPWSQWRNWKSGRGGYQPATSREMWKMGTYKHNPLTTAWEAFKGANYATSYAQGNFMTRKYRQKYIPTGLEFHYHKNPARIRSKLLQKLKPVVTPVVIPEVSQRRVKSYENNLLGTSKAMPYARKKSSKRVSPSKRYRKRATNSKNKSNRKSRTKPKSATKVLQKEVKALKQAVNTINSTHCHKRVLTGSLKSLIGRCNHYSWDGCSTALVELAMANLRYYDPAAPGTLVTANASTGTYARDVTCKNLYSNIHVRNNYQVPCKVKIYVCKTKIDQNDSVLTTYTNAIADQVINAAVDETDALIYINDIERMNEVWAIDCVVDRVLEPGQEATASHSTGQFQYDPSHTDLITDNYQKVCKSFQFMLRVEGILGHDSAVATEQSLILAGVDVQIAHKIDFVYNSGGADLEDIYISEGRIQAFTNGGVASLKPVADNLAYSIA